MGRRKSPKIYSKTVWKVALYIRLSREDGREESYSVKNQRQILSKYMEKFRDDNDEYILAGTYVDDGYTGTDSDRKDFQRLLGDIKNKLVNCVIYILQSQDNNRPVREFVGDAQ